MYLYLLNILPGIAAVCVVLGTIALVGGIVALVAYRIVVAQQQECVNENCMSSANKLEPWRDFWSVVRVFFWIGLALVLVANLIPSKEFLQERAGIQAKK